MSNIRDQDPATAHACAEERLLTPEGLADPEVVDEAVFRILESCPDGRVVAYGTVAAWLGVSNARRTAAAMRRSPEGIPWWKHVRTDGGLIPELLERAKKHWQAEGTPWGEGGVRPDAHWKPDEEQWLVLAQFVAAIDPGVNVEDAD